MYASIRQNWDLQNGITGTLIDEPERQDTLLFVGINEVSSEFPQPSLSSPV